MKDWGLYLITSQELSRGRTTLEVVQEAVAAGVQVVQLREKTFSSRELVEIGLAIREITRQHGVHFIVNDRVDVALAVEADGVHLGQQDIPVKYARQIMGSQKIIGISATTLAEALEARKAGADYLGVGPIFTTQSKPDAAAALGLEGLKQIREAVDLPLVAVGGINRANADTILEHGADCISVISAITAADNVYRATRELLNIISRQKGGCNS